MDGVASAIRVREVDDANYVLMNLAGLNTTYRYFDIDEAQIVSTFMVPDR